MRLVVLVWARRRFRPSWRSTACWDYPSPSSFRATNGTFKMASSSWTGSRKGERYFHPFGRYGDRLPDWFPPFHQQWLAARARGCRRAAVRLLADACSSQPGALRHPDWEWTFCLFDIRLRLPFRC